MDTRRQHAAVRRGHHRYAGPNFRAAIILAACLAFGSSTDARASISGIAGAGVDGTLPACSVENIVFEAELADATSSGTVDSGFDIDTAAQQYYFIKQTAAGTLGRIDRGGLNPLTLITGPTFAQTAGLPNAVPILGNTLVQSLQTSAAGVNGCPAGQCSTVNVWNAGLQAIIAASTNTATLLGSGVTFGVMDGTSILWSFNRDSGAGNELMLRIPIYGGAISSTGRANTQGNGANALAQSPTQLFSGDNQTFGRLEVWTKGTPPSFTQNVAITCQSTVDSVLYVAAQNAVYYGCTGTFGGLVGRVDLGTMTETATRSPVAGNGAYNGLAYDTQFNKLYYVAFAAGQINVYRMDPSTLVIQQTVNQALAGVIAASNIKGHVRIDAVNGRIYVASDRGAGTGASVARFRYCT